MPQISNLAARHRLQRQMSLSAPLVASLEDSIFRIISTRFMPQCGACEGAKKTWYNTFGADEIESRFHLEEDDDDEDDEARQQ